MNKINKDIYDSLLSWPFIEARKIIEDNNLSILTEKKVRRNWEMGDVAK